MAARTPARACPEPSGTPPTRCRDQPVRDRRRPEADSGLHLRAGCAVSAGRDLYRHGHGDAHRHVTGPVGETTARAFSSAGCLSPTAKLGGGHESLDRRGSAAVHRGPAVAQNNYTVTPLRLELSAKNPATVLQVTNRGDSSATLQVQQRAWLQRDGRDEQDETRDLIISPALFTFKPGETQVIRIALRGAPDPASSAPIASWSARFRRRRRPPAPNVLVSHRTAHGPAAVRRRGGPGRRPRALRDRTVNGRLVVRNDGASHIRFTDMTFQQSGRRLHSVPVFTVLAAAHEPGIPEGTSCRRARRSAWKRTAMQARSSVDVVPR